MPPSAHVTTQLSLSCVNITLGAAPFALFLWAFRFNKGLRFHPTYGQNEFMLELHLHRWLRKRGAGLLRVQNASDELGTILDRCRGEEVPALLLDNSQWLSAVKSLIHASQLIVSECMGGNPGIVAELGACIELGKTDRTVLVLPDFPYQFVDDERLIQAFPRFVHQNELDPEYPLSSPVFADLLDRITHIANLDPKERIRLTQSGELDEAIPVSFRGVAPGLFRIAQNYAREKNGDATYIAAGRAARAALAASGIRKHLDYLLRLSDLCDEAGHTKGALSMLDWIAKTMENSGSDLAPKFCKQVLASVRRRRSKWLAKLFESLMASKQGEELWNMASSQAGYAVERHDPKVIAQCLSWMAVAAVLAGKYELAKETALDAIAHARCSDVYQIRQENAGDTMKLTKVRRVPEDRFRLAFSYLYLGHAYRGLGQIREAAANYAQSLKLLPKRPIRQFHAVAMYSMGQAAEELGQTNEALRLYHSSEILAKGIGRPDLANDAAEGIKRLSP